MNPVTQSTTKSLRLQLLGPIIRLKVKSRLERSVGIFGEAIEVAVKVKRLRKIFGLSLRER